MNALPELNPNEINPIIYHRMLIGYPFDDSDRSKTIVRELSRCPGVEVEKGAKAFLLTVPASWKIERGVYDVYYISDESGLKYIVSNYYIGADGDKKVCTLWFRAQSES